MSFPLDNLSEGFWTSQNDKIKQDCGQFPKNQGQAAMNEMDKDVVLLMNSLIIMRQGGSVKSYINVLQKNKISVAGKN
jgi:hypothetical protein